jgi:mono/diheme cytochrome c family protein
MTGTRLARTFAPLTLAALIAAALAAAGCDLIPQRSAGEKLWRNRCAECHGLGGAGNTPRYMGKIYADLLDDSWRSGSDSIAIADVIRNGVFGEMPAFDQLTEEEIRLLVTYIRELRGEATTGSAR